MPGGAAFDVCMPSDHHHVLGRSASATEADATEAIDAALAAAPDWAALSFHDRAAVFLKAADLLAGPVDTLNAATMLRQGKTVQQAEIDAACELRLLAIQCRLRPGILAESADLLSRGVEPHGLSPLDGFVYAITPFNFTAIAGNCRPRRRCSATP